jgi:predicted N-acetyltransferase YhbS
MMTDWQVPMTHNFEIRPESAADKAAILALHEEAFGPGRFTRTAYRIREQATTAKQIALTAWYDARLIGAIQLTAIRIGGKSGAMLLGPLAIAPAFKNMGCGIKLMKEGLEQARVDGFTLVILVGDLPYYQRIGFGRVPPGQIMLPGPADPARLLAVALKEGALEDYAGLVAADNG